METVTDFIFLGSKIIADGECSHEIKRCLLLGRKAMTDLDSILKKQRHYFANKGPSSQSYGFPVIMYGCESWTISRKLSAKKLMFLNCRVEKTLEGPWTARSSNQFILKEICPEYSLEGLMLKLKLQYFGHLMGRADSLKKKDPDAGKDWGQEEKGWQGMRWLDNFTDSADMKWANSGRQWRTGKPGVLQSMGSQS